jgi:hypothetical protein
MSNLPAQKQEDKVAPNQKQAEVKYCMRVSRVLAHDKGKPDNKHSQINNSTS